MDNFDQLLHEMTLTTWLSITALVISMVIGIVQIRLGHEKNRLQEQVIKLQMAEAARKEFVVEVVRPRVLRNGEESTVTITYPGSGLTIPADSSTHPSELQFDLVLRNGLALPIQIEDVLISGLMYDSQSGTRRLLARFLPNVGTLAISVPSAGDIPNEDRFKLQIADAASGTLIALEDGLMLRPSSVLQLRLTVEIMPALTGKLERMNLGITGLGLSVYLTDGTAIARSVPLPGAWKGSPPWWPFDVVHTTADTPSQRHIFYERFP